MGAGEVVFPLAEEYMFSYLPLVGFKVGIYFTTGNTAIFVRGRKNQMEEKGMRMESP